MSSRETLPYVDPRARRGLLYWAFARFSGTRFAMWLSPKIVWKLSVAPRQTVEGLSISSGRIQASPFVTGITQEFERIHNYAPAHGRLLTGADDRFGREVMVLGGRPARRLFPGASAVGRRVRILDREFTVVGVYARKGNLERLRPRRRARERGRHALRPAGHLRSLSQP